MKETIVLIVSSSGLIVLGYGIRMLQEAVREWVGTQTTSSHQSDYIDWSKVPVHRGPADWPDIDYAFVDRTGCVNMQGYKPSINENEPGGWNTSVPIWDAPSDAIIGPLPPWRESLRKRPGSEK